MVVPVSGVAFYDEGHARSAARSAAYQKLVRDYLRCGATIDDNIGKLLKALDDMGIADNTIVVYVSDQGYFLGEHGFFDKRMMYEESLRMPFVIRYPKEIPAGTRNKDMILNVDFASLLADYAGVKTPKESQGHSFRDNLKGIPQRIGVRRCIIVIGPNIRTVRPIWVSVMSGIN